MQANLSNSAKKASNIKLFSVLRPISVVPGTGHFCLYEVFRCFWQELGSLDYSLGSLDLWVFVEFSFYGRSPESGHTQSFGSRTADMPIVGGAFFLLASKSNPWGKNHYSFAIPSKAAVFTLLPMAHTDRRQHPRSRSVARWLSARRAPRGSRDCGRFSWCCCSGCDTSARR